MYPSHWPFSGGQQPVRLSWPVTDDMDSGLHCRREEVKSNCLAAYYCVPGCHLLLQDRRGTGSCRHTGRSAGRHHDMSGSGHSSNGEEERDRAQSAVGGDARLHVGHLLRQDRDPHHQPDVCLQGTHARITRFQL